MNLTEEKLLKDNGITVCRELPFELEFRDTGDTATGVLARMVLEYYKKEEKDIPDEEFQGTVRKFPVKSEFSGDVEDFVFKYRPPSYVLLNLQKFNSMKEVFEKGVETYYIVTREDFLGKEESQKIIDFIRNSIIEKFGYPVKELYPIASSGCYITGKSIIDLEAYARYRCFQEDSVFQVFFHACIGGVNREYILNWILKNIRPQSIFK